MKLFLKCINNQFFASGRGGLSYIDYKPVGTVNNDLCRGRLTPFLWPRGITGHSHIERLKDWKIERLKDWKMERLKDLKVWWLLRKGYWNAYCFFCYWYLDNKIGYPNGSSMKKIEIKRAFVNCQKWHCNCRVTSSWFSVCFSGNLQIRTISKPVNKIKV